MAHPGRARDVLAEQSRRSDGRSHGSKRSRTQRSALLAVLPRGTRERPVRIAETPARAPLNNFKPRSLRIHQGWKRHAPDIPTGHPRVMPGPIPSLRSQPSSTSVISREFCFPPTCLGPARDVGRFGPSGLMIFCQS